MKITAPPDGSSHDEFPQCALLAKPESAMSISTEALGAQVAAFGWDRKRSRRLFWIHFPLFVLHVPLAFAIIGLPGAFLFGYFALRSCCRWRAAAPVFVIHEHGFVVRRAGQALRP